MTDQEAIDRLHELRRSIDNMDAALVHLLAERFRFTQAVGRLKAEHGMPPADPAREAQQIERLRRLADESGLDPGFAEAFRNLRAFLMVSSRGDDSKLIAVTSAVPREGKSLTSFCLARTLALSGSAALRPTKRSRTSSIIT